MAARIFTSLAIALLLFVSAIPNSYAATFTFSNQCKYTVWPGILSNAGTAQPPTTGFALMPGETNSVPVPPSWSGRMWGRTFCTADSVTGKFTCLTGDCGSGTVECSGGGAAPPASLAEFTLNGANGLDFYDVSLVDGYNLPMSITPQGDADRNCSSPGCYRDLNLACPTELKVAGSDGSQSVACRSACEAFAEPQYCCSGAYATPDSCKPSGYSQMFKRACPSAYSYAYDDGTSTFTCTAADYFITFCPAPTPSTPDVRYRVKKPVGADISGGSIRSKPSMQLVILSAVVVLGSISFEVVLDYKYNTIKNHT